MRIRSFVPVAVLAVVASACSLKLGESDDQAAPAVAEPAVALPGAGNAEPVAAVVDRVLPSVVSVTTDIFQADPVGGSQQGQGVGTGFIVGTDGIIVTNCHVVEGGSRITVATSAAEPREYDARVIGGDCLRDLAVLKIDATDLPTVTLGDSSDLRLGQQVVALGYALALEGGPSVTTGIVSSLDRTIEAQDPGCPKETCPGGTRTYSEIIQTDAAINHGNSGGPLVDMRGRVVGINSAGNDQAENIGFAIMIDSAKDVIGLAETDPLAAAAYLGVSTQSVDGALSLQESLGVDKGAFVVGVLSDGPAGGAGIEEGDVIVRIGEADVTSAESLGKVLADLRPDATVDVVVVRSGREEVIAVTLGTRPLPTELP